MSVQGDVDDFERVGVDPGVQIGGLAEPVASA
jgi:hypothetical protein